MLKGYKKHEYIVCRIADGETLSPGVHSTVTTSSKNSTLFRWAFILEMIGNWAAIRTSRVFYNIFM